MMQLRCTYCKTMFAISREETLAALEQMEEEKLKFYPAHCPKCRRANRIERLKLEFSYPGWRNDIKKMAKEASETMQPGAPTPAPAPDAKPEASAPSARKKHLHKPAATPAASTKAGAGSAKATAGPVAAKKSAAGKKPAPKSKPAPPAAKKPVKKSTGGTKKK